MNSDLQDVLGTEPTKATRTRTRKAVTPSNGAGEAVKPAKAKATKSGTTAEAKRPSKAVKTAPAKPAKAAKPAKVKEADDVSTTAPEDKVVLAAVRRLKEPTLASKIALSLGVHRRVIRAQLKRLAADKANGFKITKSGFNWVVTVK